MSGFALMFDQEKPLTAHEPLFADFLEAVTRYKCLNKPEQFAIGTHCIAAKLDSDSTLHRGIFLDKATGSWLLAVGTLIDTADVQSDGNLQQLLTDYLDQGMKVFERLDGHFALVIYNQREDGLVVVSDPFGFISIFYGQEGSRFFISTSSLATAKAVQSKPSELGARHFISYGGLLGELTLWEQVNHLPPATALKLTRNEIKRFTYWAFEINPTVAKLSQDESIDCIIEVLSRTWRRSLRREGKVWLSLSGGLDTRALATMVHYSGLPFKAYFHGQPDSRDVQIASLIAQKLGWESEYFDLPEDWGYQRSHWLSRTLGLCDAHRDVLKMSRIVREQTIKAQQYPVSLWGYGGETYRGYYWKQEFLNIGITSKVNYDNFLDYRYMPSDRPLLRDQAKWLSLLREGLKKQIQAVGEQHPDWPNTIKLDLIGQYLGHNLSGATISTVMGLQRAVAPLDFREGIACVLSINYKWRLHSHLFRMIFERINPTLANTETADGGPALPMRLTNLHKFTPYWLDMGEKLIWGMGRKFLGRSLWHKRDGGPQGAAYPIGQWRRDTLSQLEDEALLAPAKMYSSSLYDTAHLQSLLAEAQTDTPKEELLSRILTLEMALRTVGTSF